MKCKAMNLSRSTFYYQNSDKESSDLKMKLKIENIIVKFEGYGYRRITKQLHRDGIKVNHKKVLRIMRKYSLLCKNRKKFIVSTTDSNHNYKVYPNLTKDLKLTHINQLWVSDITYIRLANEFIYLAVILDAFSRKVVGYSISKKIDTNLTVAALQMAINKRKIKSNCIHHSDRGVQYASDGYIKLLNAHNFDISMSRKGNPYDNAKAESFMKTIKTECVYLSEYESYYDAISKIFTFIKDVYNKKRLHSSIGYLPPDEFEKKNRNIGLEHISNIFKNI